MDSDPLESAVGSSRPPRLYAAFRSLLVGRYASLIKAEDNGARTRLFIERKSPVPVASAATGCNRVLYDYPFLSLNVFHSKIPVSKDAAFTRRDVRKALRREARGPPRRVVTKLPNAVEIRRIYLLVKESEFGVECVLAGSSLARLKSLNGFFFNRHRVCILEIRGLLFRVQLYKIERGKGHVGDTKIQKTRAPLILFRSEI